MAPRSYIDAARSGTRKPTSCGERVKPGRFQAASTGVFRDARAAQTDVVGGPGAAGADPAVSSAPFVATLVDVTGLVIYFTIAMIVMKGTIL